MRKYRLSYDRHLNVWNKGRCVIDGFDYKAEHLMGIALYLEISVFKDGKEIFFTVPDGEKLCDQYFDFGVEDHNPTFGSYLSDALNFIVDSTDERGYKLELSEVAKKSVYDFKFKPDEACKWVDSWNNPIIITHEEFIDILINNMELFDNQDNKPAQSFAYGSNEVNG